MFVPKRFAADLPALDALFERDASITLVSNVAGEPFATHLPVLYVRDGERVVLRGHLARANPQWRELEAQTILAIVHGPHAYLSPTWYARPDHSVPTWNYTVGHVYGRARLIDDRDALHSLVAELAARYEQAVGSDWRFPDSAPGTATELTGIIGFELEATRIQVKHKLNQHHDDASLSGAVTGLRRQNDSGSQEIATLMAAVLTKRTGLPSTS